jgi:hypothetical protein
MIEIQEEIAKHARAARLHRRRKKASETNARPRAASGAPLFDVDGRVSPLPATALRRME